MAVENLTGPVIFSKKGFRALFQANMGKTYQLEKPVKKMALIALSVLSLSSFAGEVTVKSTTSSEYAGFHTDYTSIVTCDSRSFIGKQIKKIKKEGFEYFAITQGRFSQAPVLSFTFKAIKFDENGVPSEEYNTDAAEIVLDSSCVYRYKENKRKL